MSGQEPAVTGGPVVQLPTRFGPFQAQAWVDTATGAEHLTLSAGGDAADSASVPAKAGMLDETYVPLVRLHSECLTGDVFGSYRCDCGEQLDYALEMIHRSGGTLVYLRGHEGRGIGLSNKMRAYSLQEAGADTVEANEQLGLPVDARDYAAAAGILRSMGLLRIALLSNNPLKQEQLLGHGIDVVKVVPTEIPARAENLRYLRTKRDRMQHALSITAPAQHSAAAPSTSAGSTSSHAPENIPAPTKGHTA